MQALYILIIAGSSNGKRSLLVALTRKCSLLRDRLMVGQEPLKLLILVRFQVPQQSTVPHSLTSRTGAFEASNLV